MITITLTDEEARVVAWGLIEYDRARVPQEDKDAAHSAREKINAARMAAINPKGLT